MSSRKIDRYEYLTGEENLPSDQSRMIEQAKFTDSPLGKSFEKQIKTVEYQREKQIKVLEEHQKQLNLISLTKNIFYRLISWE